MMLGSFCVGARPKLGKDWGVVLVALCLLNGCGDESSSRDAKATPKCTSTFEACGGDPTGDWEITSYCMEGDLAAEYNDGLTPECSGGFLAAGVSVEGSVRYTATEVTYDSGASRAVTASYSPACAANVFDVDALDSAGCKEVEAANADIDSPGHVTCNYSGGNCVCDRLTTLVQKATDTYTVYADGSIAEGEGTNYEFCVSGREMVLREKLYGDAFVVTTLRKR